MKLICDYETHSQLITRNINKGLSGGFIIQGICVALLKKAMNIVYMEVYLAALVVLCRVGYSKRCSSFRFEIFFSFLEKVIMFFVEFFVKTC